MGTEKTAVCAVCGEGFVPRTRRVKTCSVGCSRERKQTLYMNDPQYRERLLECGRKWRSDPRNHERQRECRREWFRERYANDPEFRKREIEKKTKYQAVARFQAKQAIVLAEISEVINRLRTQSKGKSR